MMTRARGEGTRRMQSCKTRKHFIEALRIFILRGHAPCGLESAWPTRFPNDRAVTLRRHCTRRRLTEEPHSRRAAVRPKRRHTRRPKTAAPLWSLLLLFSLSYFLSPFSPVLFTYFFTYSLKFVLTRFTRHFFYLLLHLSIHFSCNIYFFFIPPIPPL